MLFGLNQAVAEALVLAERAGIDHAVAYDALAASAVGAPVVAYRRSAFIEPRSSDVPFSIDLGAKDLGLILDLAAQVGAKMPRSALNRSVPADASGAQLGAADLADVAVLLHSAEASETGGAEVTRP